MLLGVIADADLVEDVLQETFLIAYRRLETFRREAPFAAWLRRIAVREGLRARSRWRIRSRRVMSLEDAGAIADERSTTSASQLEPVLSLMGRLGRRERAALVLHVVEGWSYREIAEVLGCPTGTIGALIHRARARLQELLRVAEATNAPGKTRSRETP